MTTIDDLQKIVNKFCDDRDWGQFHNAKDLSIGLISEATELLDFFKYKSQTEIDAFFEDPIKKEQISHEVADVLVMLLRFAHMHEIDVSEALKNKIKINEQKYPIEKSKGSNKKYNEF